MEKKMAEDKKVKKVVKKAKQLKITKPNGKMVYRENLKGVADGYKAKGWKVEEV
tara:strand:- start:487 stop:648 length:162 start_codon:yes stop_codon:yes gene_type:complete